MTRLLDRPYMKTRKNNGVLWEPTGSHWEDTGINTDEEAASGETDIDVDAEASSAIPAGSIIMIDSEPMSVTATGTTLTVVRTQAVVHANGTDIYKKVRDCVLWLPGQDDPQSAVIRDRSGNGNDGTITGATWAQTGQGLAYLDFDGNDDIVVLGNPDSLNITGSQTFKMWISSGSFVVGSHLYGKDDEGANRQVIMAVLGAPIKLYFAVWNVAAGFSDLTGGTTVTTPTWHHCVFVYTFVADGSSLMDIYLDGAVDATQKTNAVGPIPNESTNWAMGAKDVGAGIRDYAGGIALLVHESRAWTAGQVRDDRNQDRHLFGV